MHLDENEERLLRSVALQNAQAILLARERAERALMEANEALERKTSELTEQRESFRVTLSSIGDAVITTDGESRITFMNPVAEAMTGWNLSEAIGQPIENVFRIVNERTRQPAANPVSQVLREGTVVGLANHTALIARDGRETAIDDSAAPIRTAEGKTGGVVMVFHDVTAQRKAEMALRESQERLQAALNAASTGTFRWNIETNVLEFDENLDRLFGLPAGQTIRCLETFLAAVHPDDRPSVVDACERCARHGADFEMEFRVVWPDRAVHWLHNKGKTVLNETGKPAYMTGACADITERRRADEIRSRLAEVVRSSDDAIISKDLDGVIITWNQGAERMFGYAASEVIGKPITILIPPDHLDEEPDILRRLKRGERIDHYETTRLRKDGTELQISLTVSPIKDSTGRIIGASKIARNITQRKEAEAELARLYQSAQKEIAERRKVEEALRQAQDKLSRHAEILEEQVAERTASLRETIGELEAFSYSISHDMRAPLRAMQGYALMLAEELSPQIGPEGKEYIRRIATAAERLDRLIQDVLNYSRVTRSELPLEPVQTEVLVRDILQTYPMFQQPAADIQVEGSLPMVLANQAVLTQCISNLLGNAVKFVPPAITPRVRIWTEFRDSNIVRLCFKDNGVGIERDQHEQIFGIFQRVTRGYEGTGIGLAIVKKGVERMGGRVGLESELGQGSLFWLELKLADRQSS